MTADPTCFNGCDLDVCDYGNCAYCNDWHSDCDGCSTEEGEQ